MDFIVGESEAKKNTHDLSIMEIEKTSPQRPIYRETERITMDLLQTKLEVSFDWKSSRMYGLETLTAKPHFYPSDSLILDAKGMDILRVQMEGRDLIYSYDSSYLKIKLGKTITRNGKFTVTISYIAKPEERKIGGSKAIVSDQGLYFIKPDEEDKSIMPQIWTQGETESCSVWFPTIDAPNVKTTQEILMTVEDKYVTLSNGKLISSRRNADGTRTDHWKQDIPHAPYLFMMGVGEFRVIKDSYNRLDGSEMDVNYYVEPEWEPYAKAIFGETPAMIGYFARLLGVDYPWDKYHQMVVREYVSGAMENTGAVIFGDFVYKNDRELLDGNDQSTIAHELFHHWFGDLVTCESWSNLPLNESFANYSEYLWDEFRFGLDEADYQAEIQAEEYFDSSMETGYHDLIWFDYEDREQMFDSHSYNKGGRILHMLRNYLGDEAFFKGLNLFLTTNSFKPVEFHHLRLALEEVSGEDLNWFFNQWFLASGHPVLDIKQKTNPVEGKVILSVKQSQNLDIFPIFRLPVDVAIFDAKGKHVYKLIIDSVNQEFTLPYYEELKCVVFDDQQALLGTIREEKPEEQYIFQYYHGSRYKTRKLGLTRAESVQNPRVQQLILDALNDPFWDIRLKALESATKLDAENLVKGLAIIRDLAIGDTNSNVRASALNYLASHLEEDLLKEICINRIEKDQSYLVLSTAIQQLGTVDPQLAMQHAANLELERSSKMILGIAQLYGSYASKDKFYFFEKALKEPVLKGFDQLGVMSAFTYFVARQDPEQIERAFELYAYLRVNGTFYTKMFLYQNINYLISIFDQKVGEFEEKIVTYRKHKDVTHADELMQIKKVYDSLKIKFAPLSDSGSQ